MTEPKLLGLDFPDSQMVEHVGAGAKIFDDIVAAIRRSQRASVPRPPTSTSLPRLP